MEYKSFGDYLKSLRKGKELTAEEVAEKIQTPVEKVKKWERDLEIPELDDIYKLSGFYEVPAEHLLRLKDELFKPNTKIVLIIAKILGVSVNTVLFLFWATLILGLFGSLWYLKSEGDAVIERKKQQAEMKQIQQMQYEEQLE